MSVLPAPIRNVPRRLEINDSGPWMMYSTPDASSQHGTSWMRSASTSSRFDQCVQVTLYGRTMHLPSPLAVQRRGRRAARDARSRHGSSGGSDGRRRGLGCHCGAMQVKMRNLMRPRGAHADADRACGIHGLSLSLFLPHLPLSPHPNRT
jgi:hypothetical protein